MSAIAGNLPKAAPRTVSTSSAKAPALPPPCHLRLTETSWFGIFDWAHNGIDTNGFIELFKNHAMSTSFSCMAGRWFEGPEDDEITIEWTSRKQLVQHVLKSTRCTGGLVHEFRVQQCQRRSCPSFQINAVEGWQLDNRRFYCTVGWRRDGIDSVEIL